MEKKSIGPTLKIYEELIRNHPEVKRKGKRLPYTSMKGNMFSFISKEGHIGLRFSDEDVVKYMKLYGFTEFIQNDRVMVGYVQIPDDFLENELLVELFNECYEYAKTIDPKPKTENREK